VVKKVVKGKKKSHIINKLRGIDIIVASLRNSYQLFPQRDCVEN
jgi:hypothetical protein